ncbi:sulfite exporter TauE/SafE family protein [Longispora albida]|uniref:sulfite exporter TauE/SafE family protein n=1 Tax=Longispora albida TaxID=203523 RepID=UPI00037CD9C9|nr:sulfite exporter TauE/SafE family protein [Longispora albida]
MNVPLLLGAGLAAGVVNAIAGGGSLITFPALLAAGLPPVAANVTNSIAVCPGYLASVAGSWRDLPGRVAWGLVPAALAGTAAGCALLLLGPESTFEGVVPFLVLGASLALLVPKKESRTAHPAVTHALVAGISVYGGYFGAALGVMMIAGLSFALAEPLRRISALKNVTSLVSGLTTAVVFGLFAPVDWLAVAVVAPAAIVGGFAGAKAARRIPARILRAAIVGFGVLVSGWLFLR